MFEKIYKIKNRIPRLAVLFLSLFILQAAYGDEPNLKALQGLSDTRYHSFQSAHVEETTYHLYVRLPKDYKQGEKYPVVYILDGGVHFPILGGYYRLFQREESIPSIIIVGISYGTADFRQGNQRARDYTAKSEERSYWGGAENFHRVLSREIFPLIEENYQGDPSRRIVFGQSLGGQFALYTASTAPGLFWGYIASNPALHRNLDLFLELKPVVVNEPDQPRVFVSRAAQDDPRFFEPAQRWVDHWTEDHKLPWTINITTLEGYGHFSASPEAFRLGLRWIFQTE